MQRTIILRDPRESVRKCSLTPLRGRADMQFIDYAHGRMVEGQGRVLLHHEGRLLSAEDRGRSLILVDCAWRRLPTLLRAVGGDPEPRRLPALATAYPRRSKLTPDPSGGLASIEALFAALLLLGSVRLDLLRGYRFGRDFLAANPLLQGALSSEGVDWEEALDEQAC